MPTELLPALAQLGAAGLIGWMWLTERRAAAERDEQVREAHAAILDERPRLEVLLRALDANTRAITALEIGQRQLARIIRSDAQAAQRHREPSGCEMPRNVHVPDARSGHLQIAPTHTP
jgi:hypothetical protein